MGPVKQPEAVSYVLQWSGAPPPAVSRARGPTLLVTAMRAQPGYDSPRMAYARAPHRIDYYANSRWVDAPARMLTPLLVQALEAEQAFAAVVAAPTVARTGLRLDTQLVQLLQDFSVTPSRVHLVMRAQVVEVASQAVLATRTFESRVASPSEDAAGGAAAANRALADVLPRIAAWCAQTAGERH